jgi:hypothetical protein
MGCTLTYASPAGSTRARFAPYRYPYPPPQTHPLSSGPVDVKSSSVELCPDGRQRTRPLRT